MPNPINLTLYFFLALILLDLCIYEEFISTSHQAFTIAQTQSLLEFFISGAMAQVITLSVVIIILMIRPQGLFSVKVRK